MLDAPTDGPAKNKKIAGIAFITRSGKERLLGGDDAEADSWNRVRNGETTLDRGSEERRIGAAERNAILIIGFCNDLWVRCMQRRGRRADFRIALPHLR